MVQFLTRYNVNLLDFWAHHEQDTVLQWSCGLDKLLLIMVAILPHHAFLYQDSGIWEFIFIIEEDLSSFLVLHRCSKKQENKVLKNVDLEEFFTEYHLPPLTQDMRSPFELLDQEVSGSFGNLQDLQVTCNNNQSVSKEQQHYHHCVLYFTLHLLNFPELSVLKASTRRKEHVVRFYSDLVSWCFG